MMNIGENSKKLPGYFFSRPSEIHPSISSFFRGFRVFGYLSDPSNYGNFPTLFPRASLKQERKKKRWRLSGGDGKSRVEIRSKR